MRREDMSDAGAPDPQELHAQVQHRLIEELAATEQMLRGLLRSIPEVVVQFDELGRIDFLNQAWKELLGRDINEAIGHPLFEFVVPEDRGALPEMPKRGEGEVRSTVRFLTADSCVRWFLVRLRATDSGEVTGLLEDVTDRTVLEQQLRQAQKLEAVGRLAGGVAHDFNNLLTVILGCGEHLLNDPPEDPAEARVELESLLDAARRASDLTGQLLTFGRKKPLKLETVGLGRVLEDMQPMLARLIGTDIEVQVQDLSAGSSVRTDPVQLQQVLLNLAVNARDAMRGGGTLRFELCNVESGHDPVPTSVPPGSYVRLSVSDTGSGISPEHLERIFDPFFTTKSLGEGTGLGLSTVWWLIERSGGAIEIHSEVGVGTTFRVHLPSVVRSADGSLVEGGGAEASGRSLLLVEDHAPTRLVTAELLGSKGWNVTQAESAEAALELVNRRLEPYDVLVADISLEEMDGRELARIMRSRQPWLKVVLITAYAQDGELEDDVPLLTKPFDIDQLVQAIGRSTPRS